MGFGGSTSSEGDLDNTFVPDSPDFDTSLKPSDFAPQQSSVPGLPPSLPGLEGKGGGGGFGNGNIDNGALDTEGQAERLDAEAKERERVNKERLDTIQAETDRVRDRTEAAKQKILDEQARAGQKKVKAGQDINRATVAAGGTLGGTLLTGNLGVTGQANRATKTLLGF